MNQEIQYKKAFSLFAAYQFLEDNGLKEESDDIRSSSDKFKSYSSTLRRAKVIVLVKSKSLINKFYDDVWPSGKTEKGLKRTRFFESLYQRFLDNEEGITQNDEENEDGNPVEESQFAYEADLRDYLANNLHVIEEGLRLYISESGEKGIEYIIPETQRRVDILAVDKSNDYVIIELKVSRGYEKTIGQALYYQSMVKNTFNVEKARIMLIAREISEELRMATKSLPNVQLFEYQLSLTLNQIK